MKKILPRLLLILTLFLFFAPITLAASPSPAATAAPSPAASAASTVGTTPSATCKVEDWECNSEVTFVGKLARRSLDTLDNVIKNYRWFDVGEQDKTKGNPLQVLWGYILSVVYAIIGLFILAAAFIIIYTRGENITVRRFIPRFIFIIILVTFSYSIVQFIYAMTDLIQGFFLRLPTGDFISSKNLLSVSFNYQDFIGLRRIGERYDEAATIGLVLTKLTAASYFVMSAILIIRKVILWFFILVSPVFPLLIFFSPLRNTAKIWVGEFFRWTLYAPLFAIFLRGIVEIWQRYIPQGFDFTKAGTAEGVIYPTAINILLGGPSQVVTINNNLNMPDTFIQYVVALLMIWMVIIMPFILLRIFLSYWNNLSVGEGSLAKYLVRGTPPKDPPPSSGPRPSSMPAAFKHPPGPPILPPSGDTGLARSIFEEVQRTVAGPAQINQSQTSQNTERAIQSAMSQNQSQTNINNQSQYQSQNSVRESTNVTAETANVSAGQLIYSAPIQQAPELQNAITQILTMTELNIPTIKDISRYETQMMSKNPEQRQEVTQLSEAINRIAGKSESVASNPGEQQKVTQIREQLVTESHKGNSVADSVLKAADSAGTAGSAGSAQLPEENKVQQVSAEDYDDVKKTWTENYTNIEPPLDQEGKPQSRQQWLYGERANITIVIQLLESQDPKKQKEGMDRVSKILPFLLLGGFSRQEIVTYLKAKLEAAKSVLSVSAQAQQNEDDMVEVDRKTAEKPKSMQIADELPHGPETAENGAPKLPGAPEDPKSNY